MPLVFYALLITSAIEIAVWWSPLWKVRRIILCILIPALALGSGLVFGHYFTIWAGLITFFSIYRLINLLRVLEGRMQAEQLFMVTRRTSLTLMGCQVGVAGLAWIAHHFQVSTLALVTALAVSQLVAALILIISTISHLNAVKPSKNIPSLTDRELPTLSVLIPARNETDDLEACLTSLTSSNYPKLEIIVLDDCSQYRRTPEIIKDYAHAGVRFIAGTTPPKHWLAKNHAYELLAEAANGELLMFCGVDTRFKPDSLRQMVETTVARNDTMISFIPRNSVPPAWNLYAVLLQPIRYAWEVLPPRKLFGRPPVLSTCWLVYRAALENAGGFASTANSVSPESFFARQVSRTGGKYSFLRSDTGLDSRKKTGEQRATATRLRYPQLHKRPELVALDSLMEIAIFIAPVAIFVLTLVNGRQLNVAASALSLVVLAVTYALVTRLAYRRLLLRSAFLLPLAAAVDIGLLNYSMWRYEFREVIWKDRNICLPVLNDVVPMISLKHASPSSRERAR